MSALPSKARYIGIDPKILRTNYARFDPVGPLASVAGICDAIPAPEQIKPEVLLKNLPAAVLNRSRFAILQGPPVPRARARLDFISCPLALPSFAARWPHRTRQDRARWRGAPETCQAQTSPRAGTQYARVGV